MCARSALTSPPPCRVSAEKGLSRAVTSVAWEATNARQMVLPFSLSAPALKRLEAIENGDPVAVLPPASPNHFWGFTVFPEPAPHARFRPAAPWAPRGLPPISPDLLNVTAPFGITVLEGYGMTESWGSFPSTCSKSRERASVGPAVPGGELRIGRAARSRYSRPNVFQGLLEQALDKGRPSKPYTEDGWLLDRRRSTAGINEGFLLRHRAASRTSSSPLAARNITPA